MTTQELPSFLPGVPMYGVKQASPVTSQGCDVIVEMELSYLGEPIIDTTGWHIYTTVKKSLKAQNVLWTADLTTGMYQVKDTNIFSFRIPASASSTFLPGAYFYTVIGQQKVGVGVDYDVTVDLLTGMFSIDLNAASPNPKLNTIMLTNFVFNPQTQTWAAAITSTENTEPMDPLGPGI